MISNFAPAINVGTPGSKRLPDPGALVEYFTGKYPLPPEEIHSLISLWSKNAFFDRESGAVWLDRDALVDAMGGGMITSFVELCVFSTKKENLRKQHGKTFLRDIRVNAVIDLRVSHLVIGRAKPDPQVKEYVESVCAVSKELNELIREPKAKVFPVFG